MKKPDGITVMTKEVEPISDTVLTRKEFLFIEKVYRKAYATFKQIAVYILNTNGSYVNNNTLGLAYSNTSAVIFAKKIRTYSNAFQKINRKRFEATLLLHEMGHLIGLVNMGATMHTNHNDPKQRMHCTNKNCLMYYAPAKLNPFSLVIKYKVPKLDASCIADLRANGNK